MKTLIVYDSFFGNTGAIAHAVAEGVGGEVELVRVTDVDIGMLAGLDLLIVGSPTRAFSATPYTKKFIASLPANVLSGIKVAAFDTRIADEAIKSRILSVLVRGFGYAAKSILKRLTNQGGVAVNRPEGFIVLDTQGPLKEGEQERARQWGAETRSLA